MPLSLQTSRQRQSLSSELGKNRLVRRGARRPALTMIEMLVVIVIIGLLVSIIGVASTSLINRSRTNNTKAVLQVVDHAIQDFQRERPSILRPNYLKRYGPYPPDELEVFGAAGFARIDTGTSLAPGKAAIVPDAPSAGYPTPMRFYTDKTDKDAYEHRDLAAMIIALETLTEAAASTLDQIPERNRTRGPVDPSDKPMQYLNRATPGGQPQAGFDDADFQVRYIVDDWGMPLSYITQRDWVSGSTGATESSNHPVWNQAATQLVRANGGKPLIFSYGPDGAEQLTSEAMGADQGTASLVADYVDPGAPNAQPAIDNPLNADNVYLDDGLAEKLSEASEQ